MCIEPSYGSLAISVWLHYFLFRVCEVGFVTTFVECIVMAALDHVEKFFV